MQTRREELPRILSVVSLVKRFNLTFIQSQILSLILYKILLDSPQLVESHFRAAKETLMTNEGIKTPATSLHRQQGHLTFKSNPIIIT